MPFNLFLQLTLPPAQYGRYYWVMTINGSKDWDILNKVAERQYSAISAVVKLIVFEPINITKAFGVLFTNIWKYIWYNLTFLWEIVDATLQFSN